MLNDFIIENWDKLPKDNVNNKTFKIENIYLTAMKIRNECGEKYVNLFAKDILSIATKQQNKLSFWESERSYEPEFIKNITNATGFTDFHWAPEGTLFHDTSKAKRRNMLHNGRPMHWEFITTKS